MANVVRLRLKYDKVTNRLRKIARAMSASHRRVLLSAMGKKFADIAISNLGSSGKARPQMWEPLSQRYAQRVGRNIPTLVLSPAENQKLGGKHNPGLLKRSIKLTSVTPGHARVMAQRCAYAARHQYGGKGMPTRPFFPVDAKNKITPYANLQLTGIIKKFVTTAAKP
jgi:hypothetical protein